MTQHLAAVALVVRDYDEALAFYVGKLGFELIEDTKLSDTKRWVLVAPPGAKEMRLLLAKADTPEQKTRIGNQAGRRVFLFLHTDDFQRDYEAYRARGVMKDGRRFGRPPNPYQPSATPAGKINVTDPDSRNVKTSRGYMQGYNAQAATTEQQIVIAADVTVDSPDFGHLEPMVTAAQNELEQAGLSDAPEVVVADAGYWHQAQMEAIVNRGIQVLVPPDASKRKGTRPGWDGGLYAFMRRVLQTDTGGALYRKRQAMIEPVFANTKFNRRIDRFQRRGRSAARSEWRLITATHNLLKLWKHTTAPVAA